MCDRCITALRVSLAVLAVMFAVAAFGQSTPTDKKNMVKAPSHLVVSHYIREMGLLYVEQLQNYDKACEDNNYFRCKQTQKDFQEDGILKALEDRMDINLSESSPVGDKAYRFLLTQTYYAEDMYLTRKLTWLTLVDSAKKESARPSVMSEADRYETGMLQSAKTSIPCMIEAHDIAVRGILEGHDFHTDGVYVDELGCIEGMQQHPVAAETRQAEPEHTMADYTHTGKLGGIVPQGTTLSDGLTTNGDCLVVILEDGKKHLFFLDGSKGTSTEALVGLEHTYPLMFPYRVERQKIYVPDTNADGSVADEWELDPQLAW